MTEFAWSSDKRLLHELVRRVFAVAGLAGAGALGLLFTGKPEAAAVAAVLGAVAAVAVAVATPRTTLRVEAGVLHYGSSQRVSLQGLRRVDLTQKRHVGDVLLLQTETRRFVVPLGGVPERVREQLVAVLRKGIVREVAPA